MEQTAVSSLKLPRGKNGNPLWYSYLENSMYRGAWQAAVCGGHKESDMTEHAHMQARTHACMHLSWELSFPESLLYMIPGLLFSCSVVSVSLRPQGLQHARLPSISWSLLKLMSIESVVPSNHLIFCCPLLLLPQIFPSIKAFSSESALCIRWPKYWSFSLNISPSNNTQD